MDTESPPALTAARSDLARTAAGLSKHVEVALAAVDLSISQYRVLSFLEEGTAESSVLARRLTLRPPSVTSVIDGLVSRGFVERHQSSDDRRRVRHVLTDQGRCSLQIADAAVAQRLELIASCLDDDGQSAAAVTGLLGWRQAMVAYRQRVSLQ